jgi:hypothetical protein
MARKPIERELDDELEDSFPASDPPSLTEPAGDARKRKAASKRKPVKSPRQPARGAVRK